MSNPLWREGKEKEESLTDNKKKLRQTQWRLEKEEKQAVIARLQCAFGEIENFVTHSIQNI